MLVVALAAAASPAQAQQAWPPGEGTVPSPPKLGQGWLRTVLPEGVTVECSITGTRPLPDGTPARIVECVVGMDATCSVAFRLQLSWDALTQTWVFHNLIVSSGTSGCSFATINAAYSKAREALASAPAQGVIGTPATANATAYGRSTGLAPSVAPVTSSGTNWAAPSSVIAGSQYAPNPMSTTKVVGKGVGSDFHYEAMVTVSVTIPYVYSSTGTRQLRIDVNDGQYGQTTLPYNQTSVTAFAYFHDPWVGIGPSYERVRWIRVSDPVNGFDDTWHRVVYPATSPDPFPPAEAYDPCACH